MIGGKMRPRVVLAKEPTKEINNPSSGMQNAQAAVSRTHIMRNGIHMFRFVEKSLLKRCLGTAPSDSASIRTWLESASARSVAES
mmetsp:Transcript_33884/g.64773  ORF Transcript_33884/g.64773 Transcript_33884/m.64773 type:complete len:85 (-) Transcript_33884:743-997(-)